MPAPDQHTLEGSILSVLTRLNEDLPAAERIPIDPSTPIMGDGGALDSLGIANFLVAMEEDLERSFGASVALSDQDLLGLFEEPTVTVRSFAAFVLNRLTT